jgi:hypothetical protein
MVSPVPDMLTKLADIYRARNLSYGDNYKLFGSVMRSLFPEGLQVTTSDDWNRLGVLVQIVSKLTRYTNNFSRGGHRDSLDDTAVYAMMLRELDEDVAGVNGIPFEEKIEEPVTDHSTQPIWRD